MSIFKQSSDFCELESHLLLVTFCEGMEIGLASCKLPFDYIQDVLLGGKPHHPLLVLTANHLPRSLDTAHLVAHVGGGLETLGA